MTTKWNIVNDQSNTNYDIGNKIIYNREVMKSSFSDYKDGYILLCGDITIKRRNLVTEVAFKNCT